MLSPGKRIVMIAPLLAVALIAFAWLGPHVDRISYTLVDYGLAVPAMEAPDARFITGSAPGIAYTFGPLTAWAGVYLVLMGVAAIICFTTRHPELDFPMTETERSQFAAMQTGGGQAGPEMMMMEDMDGYPPPGPDMGMMTPAQQAAMTGQVPNRIPGITQPGQMF